MMNQKIQEGMEKLYGMLIPYSDAFNKKTYESMFKEEYEKFKDMFDEIVSGAESAEDRSAFVEAVAGIIPGMMHKELDAQPNKRKKEFFLMKHNLGMVSFVIPMLLYGRRDVLNVISERMIVLWNDHNIDMKIGSTTFEEIQSGFKTHLCYITTAVCESLGKPDDCYELNILRNYRDEYLVKTSDGAALVNVYYDIAPTIVKRISREENAENIYQNIWNQYLKPCVSLIEDGRKEECRDKYTDMVHSLQEKYLYS